MLLQLAAAALLALQPAINNLDGLAWPEMAGAYRTKHAIEDVVPGEAPFEAFQAALGRAFCGGQLGVFDVRFTRSYLTEAKHAEELRGACLALLDLQGVWMERFAAGLPESKAAAADLTKLRKWIERARVTKNAMESPATDLLTFFGGADEERALATRLADALTTGGALGFKAKRERPVQVVLTPTRQDFVELCAYVGWLDEPWRGTFWVEGVPGWTEFYWNDLQVVAMQYPPVVAGSDPFAGAPMDEEEKTGLWQHVAQRGAHALCCFAFARTLDAAFEAGLAQELVAGIYGDSNTRSGGNGRGATRDGWSMFVPGGASQGGALPALSAETRWREKKGSDHYVEVLQLAQKEGSKDARNAQDKLPCFEIRHDDDVQKRTVCAPFFGQAAQAKPLPPADYVADYREFFRAYKACFLYWLTEQAEGNAKKSHAKLAQLFAHVADSVPAEGDEVEGEAPTFESLLVEVYGRAWSAEQPDPANLEWEFLAWLAKQ